MAKTPEQKWSFGRYSDAYKSKQQLAVWDECLKLFEEHNYHGAIKSLVEYLKNPGSDNIRILESEGSFSFILYQGSKQIECLVTDKFFKAQCKIAHCNELNVGFLRKAVEYNYELNYSRFSLDGDNNLCVIFDCMIADSSPYKLYYGLKELAIQSDKEDDLLLGEFASLEPIDNHHIRHLPEDVLNLKINFLKSKISHFNDDDLLGSLNAKRYPGAMTYVYLSAMYAIDYLVKPEGKIMDLLSNMHIKYFENSNLSIEDKLEDLKQGFLDIAEMEDEEIRTEIYDVVSTFGVTSPINHAVVSGFIEKELEAFPWYAENGHDKVCLAICNYIAGFCLYNFALPGPDKDLFHLYFELAEPDFFNGLNKNSPYWDLDCGKMHIDEITDRIEDILDAHRKTYSDLPKSVKIENGRHAIFLRSFLNFIQKLPIR